MYSRLGCVAEYDVKPPSTVCWDYRCVLPCRVYAVLGLKLRALLINTRLVVH